MAYNPGGGSGSGQLSTSGDVTLNNPATGDVLTYDGGVSKWKNGAAASGSLADNSVSTAKLQNGAVSLPKLAASLAHVVQVTINRTGASAPNWVDNTGTVVDPVALHAAGFGIMFVCDSGLEPVVGTANGQAKMGRDIVFQVSTGA